MGNIQTSELTAKRWAKALMELTLEDENVSKDEIFDGDNFVMPESNQYRPPLDGNIFDYDIEMNEPTINYEDQEEEEVYNDSNFSTEDNRG